MIRKIGLLHLIVGLVSIIGFVISGKYLSSNEALVNSDEVSLHALYRANHIYILFASIVNLILGFSIAKYNNPRFIYFLYLGSFALVLSTIILGIAFYIEPAQNSLDRPITANSLFLFLGGSIFLLLFKLTNRH